MSASDSGLPRLGDGTPGLCAKTALAPNASAAARANWGLRIDMFDFPFAVDAPAGDAVVVLIREGEWSGERLPGLAPRRDEFGTQGLHIAGLIPGAALQDRRLAVPAPRHLEAGEGLVVDRLLQCGLAPALAAVGRNRDLGNAAGARISNTRDGIETRFPESVAERGVGDEALHLHQEVEPPRLAARQNLRIVLGFEERVGRLIDRLDAAQELDVHIALVAGHEEAHRIAVAGHQALAVLVDRDQCIVVGL